MILTHSGKLKDAVHWERAMSRDIDRESRTEKYTLCDEKGPRRAVDLKLDIYDNYDSIVSAPCSAFQALSTV